MAWNSLGTLTLSRDWQLFPVQSIGCETFRVSQPGVQTVDGYFLVQPYYVLSQAIGGSRRFYPTSDQKIMVYPYPPEFEARDLTVRMFGAKLAGRARIFAGQVWQVTLEEFY